MNTLTSKFDKMDPAALRQKLVESLDAEMECSFYQWHAKDGQIPFVEYKPLMEQLWIFFADHECGKPFDYVEWYQNFVETHKDDQDDVWVNEASRETLDKVLFSLRRGERFCEGLAAGNIRRGFYLKVFDRLVALQETAPVNEASAPSPG